MRIFIDIREKYQVGIVFKKKKKKENSREKFDFYATETNYAENREGGRGFNVNFRPWRFMVLEFPW